MSATLEMLLRRVVDEWISFGVRLDRRASAEDIGSFEKRYAVQLPSDIEAFFITVGGMDDAATDELGIRFWPLDEVEPAHISLSDGDPLLHGYFVFADYSIWAHGYAIQLTTGLDRSVAIVGAGGPRQVASSFTEFLERYLDQPRSIFVSNGATR